MKGGVHSVLLVMPFEPDGCDAIRLAHQNRFVGAGYAYLRMLRNDITRDAESEAPIGYAL